MSISDLPPESSVAGIPFDNPNPKPKGLKKTQSDMSESQDVNRWQGRINVAKKYRDRVLQDLGVERFYKEYLGEYDVRIGSHVAPAIGEVFAYVQSLVSDMAHQDPYVAVNAAKKGSIQGAAILETTVNYYNRILRSKEEYEIELIDAILAGHGWHKTGMYVTTVGSMGDLQIDSEQFYSNRVSYKDVVFNIGSRRPPNDCRWIAQRLIRPTDEVKDKYGAKAVGIIGGAHPSLKEEEMKASNFKGDMLFSTLWEIHDIKDRKIYLIAEGHSKYLKVSDWPEYVNQFPFRMLWWNYNPDSPYPVPDVKAWEPQVLEEIKFVGMIMNHLKRWSRQLLVKKGAISITEMDKLEKGIDGSVIEVKTSGAPNEAAQPLAYAPLPPEIFGLLNILSQLRNRMSGQPDFEQGGSQKTNSRTEGELVMIQKGSKSRTDRKVSRFEDHIEDSAKDLIAHMQGNFDTEQIIKITGDTPQEIIQAFGDKYDQQTGTIRFSKDDIQGEYDINVQAGSTLPLDKETRMQLLSIILDKTAKIVAMVPNLPPFMRELIKLLLKDYDIKPLEKAFEEQQVQADQMKQAQTQNAQVDQDKVKAETKKRLAQADELKAQTVMELGRTLHDAHQANILPEAIELGRGMGILPDTENENGAMASPIQGGQNGPEM